MNRLFQLCVLMGFLTTGLVAQDQPPTLKIYVYNQADVPQETLAHAERRTSDIFREAGVQTTWYACSTLGTVRYNCSGLLGPNTVTLQIVHDSRQMYDSIFGAAFLGADGMGQQADIYFDRIRSFSQEENLTLPDITGYVVAHELGHLLLGLNAHSWIGIMKATWERSQLENANKGELWFSRPEAKRIRRRLTQMSLAAEPILASTGSESDPSDKKCLEKTQTIAANQ
jgi:hypothetical protein